MSSNKHAKSGRPTGTRNKDNLSDKQRNLCLFVAQGQNHTQAYRLAYNSTAKQGTCAVNAYTELNKPHVAEYLDSLREKMRASIDYSLDKHVRELEQLAINAEASGNYGAAAQCRISIGKATGLYTDKLSIKTEELAPAALLSQLETIDPNTAAIISQALGLDKPTSTH